MGETLAPRHLDMPILRHPEGDDMKAPGTTKCGSCGEEIPGTTVDGHLVVRCVPCCSNTRGIQSFMGGALLLVGSKWVNPEDIKARHRFRYLGGDDCVCEFCGMMKPMGGT